MQLHMSALKRSNLCLRTICKDVGLAVTTLTIATTSLSGVTAIAAAAPTPEGLGFPVCTIWGGTGNDTLIGTSGNDVICGQAGVDTIHGNGGRDRLYSGSGNDTIYGGDTASGIAGVYDDDVYGGTGNDRVYGGGGRDSIKGEAGDDYIEAGNGDDNVKGDFLLETAGINGNDTIFGGSGSDSIDAGGGRDFVDSGTSTAGEIVYGGSGNDVLIGKTAQYNTFDGGTGSDLLFPTVLRTLPLGNSVKGGDGNDIAILTNGMLDAFVPGKTMQSVPVPIPNDCQIRVPLKQSGNTSSWSVDCGIIGPVSISITGNGTPSIGSDFYSRSLTWNPAQWRQFADQGIASLKGDLCVCDLKIPIINPLGDQVY